MLHTPICARIPNSKDRLAIFTNYPSVTKDKALEETVVMDLFHPVVYGCFQLIGVTIEGTMIALHYVGHQRPTLKSRSARFSAHLIKNITFIFYSL